MAYSQDLRIRAVESYLDGEGSYDEIASRYKIGPASLKRWVSRYRKTGSLEPLTKNNRRPFSLDEQEQALLKQFIDNSPHSHDQELADALEAATGKKIHRSTVNDYWHRWGYTRKKSRLWPPSSAPTASTP